MGLDVVIADRRESAGADMQGQEGALDAAIGQAGEQRIVQVQSGSRRGDRTGMLCKHGLIAVFVDRVGGMPDVGRQGQLPRAIEQIEHRRIELQPEKRAVSRAHGGDRIAEMQR